MRLFCTICIVGEEKGQIRGGTVWEIINNLCDERGAEFRKSIFVQGSEINDNYVIMVNGKPLDAERGLDLRVRKGDAIAIVPALGGGQT